MKSALSLLSLLAALLLTTPAMAERPEEPELRTEVVTLKYIEPHDAAQVLRSLSSRWGQIDHNRDLKVITIVDQPALVEKMLEIIADLDKPSTQLDFGIYLVIAGPKEAGAKKPGPELDDVMGELKKLFAYESYSIHDRAAIRMLAGREAAIQVGGTDGFRLEIGSRGEPGEDGRIGLDLNLYRPRTLNNDGNVVIIQDTVVATSIDVRDGETTVVGASKLDGDDRALITILRTRVGGGR